MRVIESRSRYAPKARFTTWLYTIAHNLLVDHWRRKGLSLVSLDGEDAASESANPARQAEGRQALARLLQALDNCRAAQREAFLLHQEGGTERGRDRSGDRRRRGSGEEPAALCDGKLKTAVDDN